MKLKQQGFTLIEIMLGILIFSIVIIGGFQALSSITLGRIKLVEKTDITKDAFYFSEKLFEEIKKGGTIDYEEYFNRKVIGNTAFSSGHYAQSSGFGNFGNNGVLGGVNYGNGFYYCRSQDTIQMGTGGCFDAANFNDLGANGGQQRYGEYVFQFIDYNSNINADGGLLGDEDGDGNIRGDDDDENLGQGPIVFTGGVDIKEIYLISGDRKKRTYFRWNWQQDPDSPKDAGGNYIYPCNATAFGSGCLGNIEFLKLDGVDWGMNHQKSGTGYGDGIVDTWLIDKNLTGGVDVVAASDTNNYWQPLFPNALSVNFFEVYMYPEINKKYAWKNASDTDVNPYLKLQIGMTPSWKKRVSMKGKIPDIRFSTTVNLADYFSK